MNGSPISKMPCAKKRSAILRPVRDQLRSRNLWAAHVSSGQYNETTQRFVPHTGGETMALISKNLVVLLGAVVLMVALAGSSPAQTVVVAPAPRVAYYAPPTVVSYYAAPVCYPPAPVVSYYSPPAISYSPPAVSYYAPPAVSYYSPQAVVAAPTTVSTYRGILPWRTYTTATYGAAPLVTAPSVRYYSPVYYYP
jgi:hypothetical protein